MKFVYHMVPKEFEGDKLKRHIDQSKRDGRNPVMFGNIPHVLYKGTLLTANLQIIKV